MNTENDILVLKNLEIGFRKGRKIIASLLSGMNVSAGRGELVALIGQNGIGKSTLLKTIVHLHEQLNGEILFNKRDRLDYTAAEFSSLVGFVSTEVIRVGNLTVRDLISLGRFPYTNWLGKLTEDDHGIVDQAMEMVNLLSFADKNLSEISDGERQRAMIARTIAQDTDILILDEPTAFLDLPNRYEVIHLLRHLSEEKGKLVIFSTHDLEMVINEADKIWMIAKDELIEGAPEDLVLNGSFNYLFPGSKAVFNKESGSFSYMREGKREIILIGSGTAFEWTKKALKRKSYIPVSNGSSIKIHVDTDKNSVEWVLSIKNKELKVYSIQELLKVCQGL
ncbi:MAG: ABC transporter ATP-binding protein [Bacteroidales bacterium]|nr:ABC transporter ATP-binding protein [Bacteroidales bacterium]